MICTCTILLQEEKVWTMEDLHTAIKEIFPNYRPSHSTIALRTKGLISYYSNPRTPARTYPWKRPADILMNYSVLVKEFKEFTELPIETEKNVITITFKKDSIDNLITNIVQYAMSSYADRSDRKIVAMNILDNVANTPDISWGGKEISSDLARRLVEELEFKTKVGLRKQ